MASHNMEHRGNTRRGPFICHARAGGHPASGEESWVPAFAGMTGLVMRVMAAWECGEEREGNALCRSPVVKLQGVLEWAGVPA